MRISKAYVFPDKTKNPWPGEGGVGRAERGFGWPPEGGALGPPHWDLGGDTGFGWSERRGGLCPPFPRRCEDPREEVVALSLFPVGA